MRAATRMWEESSPLNRNPRARGKPYRKHLRTVRSPQTAAAVPTINPRKTTPVNRLGGQRESNAQEHLPTMSLVDKANMEVHPAEIYPGPRSVRSGPRTPGEQQRRQRERAPERVGSRNVDALLRERGNFATQRRTCPVQEAARTSQNSSQRSSLLRTVSLDEESASADDFARE